jgi:hypothetical protein
MSNPYVALLMDMYDINKNHASTLERILTSKYTALIDQAIQELPAQNVSGRMILILERYYGIRCEKTTLAQIGDSLIHAISSSRVGQIRGMGLRLLRCSSTLQPVARQLKTVGFKGRAIEQTLSLPSPAQMAALQDLVATNQQFKGTFLLDCFPDCRSDNPCPSCQAKKILSKARIKGRVMYLARVWQSGPSDDWQSVKIDRLGFSVRTLGFLKTAHIETLGQLVSKRSVELSHVPHFGRKRINEVKEKLAALNLKLAE